MRRKAAEPHFEDGGIYRMRWWARVDGRWYHLRDVVGGYGSSVNSSSASGISLGGLVLVLLTLSVRSP